MAAVVAKEQGMVEFLEQLMVLRQSSPLMS